MPLSDEIVENDQIVKWVSYVILIYFGTRVVLARSFCRSLQAHTELHHLNQ